MASVAAIPRGNRTHRIGGWMPLDKTIIRDHVNYLVKSAKEAALDYVGPIDDLSNLIQNNPVVYMLFTEMLSEVPDVSPYNEDPSLQPEIRDIKTLLDTLNFQIQAPIKYNDSVQIGTPINAILDWPMGTKAGFAAFLRDDVNACFAAILQQWGNFLTTSASLTTVTTADGGWLSQAAQTDKESPGLANFLQTYQVPDPSSDNYGFASWDKFFTRLFLEGLRPVASPTDSSVVVSAAESTPFSIQYNVQLQDQFWAKNQSYALEYLLGDPDMAQKFVGGTVYQAFLSADSYHNWHAPVSGKWLATPKIIPGTYYSEPLLWGFSPDVIDKLRPRPDPAADARSQGYISCVAQRGVGFIQPDDASLGIIAVVMIGMAEVSSIQFDQGGGDSFIKGEMIGRFHFGGSSHCLVFQPGVTFTPAPNAQPIDPTHVNISQPVVPVCSELGTLTPNSKQ